MRRLRALYLGILLCLLPGLAQAQLSLGRFYFTTTLGSQFTASVDTSAVPYKTILGCETDLLGGTIVNGLMVTGGLTGSPATLTGYGCANGGDASPSLGLASAGNTVKLGGADVAAPANQVLGTLGVLTGTSNTAGASLSVAAGQGTGTGAGGALALRVAYPGTTGTTQNALGTIVSLAGSNTQSSGLPPANPLISLTPTVNQSGTAGFAALYLNLTETATGSGTHLLADLQTAGTDEFTVDDAGGVHLPTNTAAITMGVTADTILSRHAAQTLQLGAADAAVAVAQTLGVQNVLGGTSNVAGAPFTLDGSRGTGTGVGGNILVKLAYPGTTGSTQNTLATVATLNATNNAASGATQLITFSPTAVFTGTAGYTALYVNATENSIGSGVNQLLALASGGTQRFGVTNGANATGTQIRTAQLTVPTCTANCGTGTITVVGSDSAGIVTLGSTGSPASNWVITFNGTWAAAPSCNVMAAKTGMVSGKAPIVVVTTQTMMTVTTNGTAPANSDVYSWLCVGVL